ncbi:branched-chain amino acid ABC transporter permease [Rhizobiales bacterium L72]|uniref:Branched-chain amino acid ABC transporter permease n=2 Tax=Propylenella binzhouense TaxID=2555902 RepID=A0A964T400_9HYPH|nr:branched-chain amino acid ABC transporter permease [Propylenella binzhouense]
MLAPAAILAAAAAVAAAPMVVGSYGISVLINLLNAIVLATAWAFFSGPTRYVSLAAGAFFGTGAYAVAVLGEAIGYVPSLLAAALTGAVLAAIVGLATLRLRGMYFVIFTFGLSELVRELVNWWEFNVTHTVGRYVFLDVGEAEILWQLAALAAVLLFGWWLRDRSRIGYALEVIGADETVARQIGIGSIGLKLATFVLSSVAITLAGAILAPRWSFMDPTIAFNPTISFMTVVTALLGGMRRFWGPALGAVPLALLSDYLATTVPDYFSIVLGLAFLAIVFFVPDGLSGLLARRTGGLRPQAAGLP